MPNPLKTEGSSKVVERVGVPLLWSANLGVGISRSRRDLDRSRQPSTPHTMLVEAGANGLASGSDLGATQLDVSSPTDVSDQTEIRME